MFRPLLSKRITELEALYTTGKSDPKILKALENELQHRQVPRAVTLLANVRKALAGPSTEAAPTPTALPSGDQKSLRGDAATPNPPAAESIAKPDQKETGAVSVSEPESEEEEQEASSIENFEESLALPPLPDFTLEQAYKELKAGTGAAWESLEKTRRQVVQQSSPELLVPLQQGERVERIVAAQRANAAFRVILRHQMTPA